MICRICGNEAGNRTYRMREIMMGLDEHFEYFECAACGCLQIAQIPKDMARYYPPEYYSLAPVDCAPDRRLRRLHWTPLARRILPTRTLARLRILVDYRNLLGLRLRPDSRILDVGCGSGGLICRLHSAGFPHVLGLDPFLPGDVTHPNGVRVLRRDLLDFSEGAGTWDVVMFQHSFEHIAEPQATLCRAAELLAPGGTCLIAIPTASSYAWEHYRESWVQIDAPRHFFLHTRRSMSLLAQRAGLTIVEELQESTNFQFWGSEQVRAGIPLHHPDSYYVNPSRSRFTPAQMREWQRQARRLNRRGRGDTVTYYLAPARRGSL
jgi:SAM-dependent methyltransferase